jgi:hypothetical protein
VVLSRRDGQLFRGRGVLGVDLFSLENNVRNVSLDALMNEFGPRACRHFGCRTTGDLYCTVETHTSTVWYGILQR